MYGPDPTAGVRVDASKSTLLSTKYFCEKIGNPPTVLIKSLLGTSSLKINFILESEISSAFFTSFSKTALKEGRPFSFSKLKENSTSLAVKGDPSENFTKSLSVKITQERSSGY